jgi:hypothetical protein
MGSELDCRATIEGVDRQGRAMLESDHILFRGSEYRLKIPLAGLDVKAVDGELKLGRFTTLHLGDQAAKWAHKIANPKSLLDKLGVKAGQSIAALAITEPEFLAQLPPHGKRLKQNLDIVFLGVEQPAGLARLPDIWKSLAPAGAVWIVYPKGTKTIPESTVMREVKAAGLVDVKVAAFSKTHTAIKAVIPKLAR